MGTSTQWLARHTMLKILVADDHALMREALIGALAENWPEAVFVEVADGPATLGALHAQAPFDLALLDLFMPGVDGFGLLSEICDAYPDTPVVVISAAEDPADIRRALDYGAAGFIPKSTERKLILAAVDLVLAGGVYVPPQLLAGEAAAALEDGPAGPGPASRGNGGGIADLTERQLQVLRLLGLGLSNKAIARELGLAENTVKIHVAAVFRALGASNRTHAVMIARDRGILLED